MPVPRARFRQGLLKETFVVTAPVKISSGKFMLPGEDFDTEPFSTRFLRSLYRRKRIGIKGSPWANGMIERYHVRQQLALERSSQIAASQTREQVLLFVADTGDIDSTEIELSDEEINQALDNAASIASSNLPDADKYHADAIQIEQNGSWFVVTHDGQEIAKLHGQVALDAWKHDHVISEVQQNE